MALIVFHCSHLFAASGARKKAKGGIPTFGACADALIEAKEGAWHNAKHRYQWRHTLTEYAAPLRSILQPWWKSKPETASRLRGRIEAVLDAARAKGLIPPNTRRIGFRSSFWDWVGECTSFPREVAEAALAHAVGDEVERAYRRADALTKRRKLMDAWASFCAKPQSAKVIALRC